MTLTRKCISIILTAVMLLSLSPVIPGFVSPAQAAPGEDLQDRLKLPKDDPGDSGKKPTGSPTVYMNEVSEIYIGNRVASAGNPPTAGRTGSLYGDNTSSSLTPAYTDKQNTYDTNVYDAYLAVAGDFTGSGKRDKIVALGANTKYYDTEQDIIGDSVGLTIQGKQGIRNDSECGLFMFFIEPKTADVSSGTNIFHLYAGEIGTGLDLGANDLGLGNGYLRFHQDVDSDSGGGGKIYNPLLLYNYMQVAAADFTGDGIDEIAVFVPDNARPRVDVYQFTTTGSGSQNWWEKGNWSLMISYAIPRIYVSGMAKYTSNMVDLAVGDLNRDGIDDLAIGVGAAQYNEFDSKNDGVVLFSKSKVEVLFGNNERPLFNKVQLDPGRDNRGEPVALAENFGLTIGDPDGSGKDKLIFAGLTEVKGINSSARRYDGTTQMFMWEYNSTTKQFVRTSHTLDKTAILGNGDKDTGGKALLQVYPHVRADAVALSPGTGMPDVIYYRGWMYHVTGNSFVRATESIYGDATTGMQYIVSEMRGSGNTLAGWDDVTAVFEYGLQAVNLNIGGSGAESLAMMFSPLSGNDDGPIARPASATIVKLDTSTESKVTKDLPDSMYQLSQRLYHSSSLNWPEAAGTHEGTRWAEHRRRSDLLIAFPDLDNDSRILTYVERRFTYSEPEVLAVIAGAPVWKDLEIIDQADGYIGESGTAWATSKGSGSGTVDSTQFSVGAFVSVDIMGAATFEAEYKHTWTEEFEKTTTVTETVQYGTSRYYDSVVLYSIPMDVYVYSETIPTNGNDTATKEVLVYAPHQPAVTVMSVSEYEELIPLYPESNLPKIRGANAMLTHEEGYPDTYPASAPNGSSISDVRIYGGHWANVGYDTGFITQEISVEKESTTTNTTTNEFSIKIGGGFGGVTAGITGGGAWESGSTSITTSGTTFSGTVYNMPDAARAYDYGYRWKIMQFWYKHGDDKIPVVTYLVDAPASSRRVAPPVNLRIDNADSTLSSIKMTWDYKDNEVVDGFEVYRQSATGNLEAVTGGFVKYEAGKKLYSFTDRSLEPGTQYTYAVVATKNGNDSVYSNSATGWTLLTNTFTVELNPKDVNAYVDETITVNSTINSLEGGPLSYVWEKKNGESWSVVQGQTRSNLHIPNPAESVTGVYRLRVTQSVSGKAAVKVSDPVNITVTKRPVSVIEQTVTEDSSGNITMTAKVINKTNRMGNIPTGTVDFEVCFRGAGPAVFPVQIEPKVDHGFATLTLEKADFGLAFNVRNSSGAISGEGLYSVTPVYSGDSVFQSHTGNAVTYLSEEAESMTEYYAVYDQEIYSQVAFTPKFFAVSGTKGETGTTVTEIENDKDGYSIEFSSMQYISGATQIQPVFTFTTATASYPTHYTFSGTTITPRALDSTGRLKWPYHYIATFNITNGAESGTATLAYAVKSLPIKIAANITEISTSERATFDNAAALINNSRFFNISSPTGIGTIPANMNTYFDATVSDAAGDSIPRLANANLGRYTLSATPTTGTADYQFILSNGVLDIVGNMYAHTAEVSDGGGTVAIGYGVNTTGDFLNGSSIICVAHPDKGYEVERWEVTRGGAVVSALTKTGNNLEFGYETIAVEATITVYFKEKNTTLTYSAEPDSGGAITLDSPEDTDSGEMVIGDTPLDFSAEPAEGYTFGAWRIFYNERAQTLPGVATEAGGSKFYTYMPDSVFDVRALFVRDSYQITFSEGLAATRQVGGQTVNVSNGEKVPGDTEITVVPQAGKTVTEWLEVPEDATMAPNTGSLGSQMAIYVVKENANFKATVETFFDLTLTTPIDGSITATVDGVTETLFDGKDTEYFEEGTVVNLTAVPTDAETHSVGYWTEDGLMRDMGETTIDVTMTANVTIGHVFMEIKENPELTFNDTAMTSSADLISPAEMQEGTTVSFAAIVPEGYVVSKWTYIIDLNEVIAQVGGDTLTFDMPSHDIEVRVETVEATYNVTINSNPNGGVFTVTFDGLPGASENPAVPHGDKMVLTVTPNNSWELAGVDIAEEIEFDKQPNPIAEGGVFEIESVTSDITIDISFTDNTLYPISVGITKYGTVTAPLYAKAGETVKLTAKPDAGFALQSYSVNNFSGPVVVGSNGAFVMPNSGVEVSAVFTPTAPNGPSISIINSPPKDFLVSFDSRGGSVVESQRVKSSETASRPSTPTKKYYSFIDWFYSEALTRPFDFNEGIIEDLILYAGWHWNNPFIDVKDEHWFYGDVEYMHVNEVFSGITPTTFEPETPMTRAMIVTVLYRLEGRPGVEQLTNDYSDVESDKWYTPAVLWASENGIVQGYEDGKFYPDSPVSREQLAAIIYRYTRVKGIELKRAVAEYDFVDEALIAGYAAEAVYAMQRAGIINGKAGNLFDPKGLATRAEVAATLHRFMVNYPQGKA